VWSTIAPLATRRCACWNSGNWPIAARVPLMAAQVAARRAARSTAGAADNDRARLRAGIRAILDFSSADPRRGKILFTEARTDPVLAARRTMAQDNLRELVLSEGRRAASESDCLATEVGAAMYAGAMAELAQQWLAGTLGRDLDAVVTHAVRVLLPG
jgi:hypothetical protein